MVVARQQLVRLNRLPPIAVVAISLALGMAGSGFLLVPISVAAAFAGITALLSLAAGVLKFSKGVFPGLALLAVFFAGFLRSQLSPLTLTESRLQHFCVDGAVDVVADGQIASMPILHRRPLTALAPRMYGPPQQTRFVFHLSKLRIGDDVHDIDARCRTYVSGRAAERLSVGDMVSISGRLDWPKAPGNPNEFNFRAFLLRHNMDGMLFVDSESDLVVKEATSFFDYRRWLSRLRSELYRILARYVGDDVRGIANALLLGSRHELPPETQHAFMASGTMHLLAISGLHVGILWMVTLQILHVLLVPRRLALVMTLMVCVVYALLTDLRPSVFRATVFLAVFVAGQMLRRDQQMSALLAVTAIIMLLYDPTLVLEVGSWLSFLSVAALSWLGSTANTNPDEREAPPDAITLAEQIAYVVSLIRIRLGTRYRQTMAILLFTSPLVASTFHVVSPIGIILNLALIPLTAVVLCAGFASLAVGLLLPILAFVPGVIFSALLSALVGTVSFAADIPGSHFFIAKLPAWFLPVYYGILVCVLLIRSRLATRVGIALLIICMVVAVIWPTETETEGLRCTVLDVGQGNAVVVECPGGEVFVIDAGAEGRAMRSADAVSNYLWSRGQRHIDAILVSHPDLSHCNALPGVLARFSVDRVLMSKEFLADDHPATFAILDRIEAAGSQLETVGDGDAIIAGDVTVSIHQTSVPSSSEKVTADELSLVAEIEYDGRTILLPGDLKGAGSEPLLRELPSPSVLLAAGHGSKTANSPDINDWLRPQNVVVSSRDDANRTYLESVLAAADSLHFTSKTGAVTIRWERDKPLQIDGFRGSVAGFADVGTPRK